MINLNADEIFEMAEQMERNGAKFYRKAAESTDEAAKSMLLGLAAMEDDHERTFAAMRGELSHAETQSQTPDPENQAVLYLQSMVSGKVFGEDPSATLTGTESLTRILEIAIGLEKDSIVFYQSMKSAVPKDLGQQRIDDIIDQEIGHILTLTKQLTGQPQ